MTDPFIIDADLKKESYIKKIKVTSNDTNTFVVNVFDDGEPLDLTDVTTVSIAHTRPDKEVVVKEGTKTGINQVSFELGTTETAINGRVKAVVQLYDAEGRVSTLGFTYEVVKDPTGDGFIGSETEQTLIQIVLGDGPLIIEEAQTAADYANTQGDYALQVAVDNETRFLNAVSSVALRDSTYPTPAHGDTVRVTGTATTYRYVSGEGWVVTDVYNPTAIDEVTAQLAQKAEQDEVRFKAVKLELEDTSDTFISAITGGATVNVLSIPQDNSVTPSKLSSKYDIFDAPNAVDGRYITGYNTTTLQPNYISNGTQFTYQLDITNYKKLKFLYPSEPAGGFLFSAWDVNLKWISGNAILNRATLSDGSKTYVKTVGTSYYEIDVTELLRLFPNAKYAIVSYVTGDKPNCYIDVLKSVKLANYEWYDNSLQTEVDGIKTNAKKMLLPVNLRIMLGVKFNIYLDNFLRYGDIQDFYRFYSTYPSYFIPRTKKHLEVIPQNVADYQWRITGYERLQYLGNITKNVNVKHVPTTSGSGLSKKVLFIGDSMTNAAQYTQFLIDKFSTDSLNIELIGTRGTGANKHEGRSGWRAHEYVNRQTGEYGELVSNPFYNAAVSKFDFSYYMSNNGFTGVDIVFINLGTNDVSRTNFNADTDITDSYSHMISSIKAYNPNVKILLWLPPIRAQFTYLSPEQKDTALRATELLISSFDNRENENIFLVPVYLNVDPENDYVTTDLPLSEGSLETYKYPTDIIHPTSIGYQHIADVIYPYLKYVGGLA